MPEIWKPIFFRQPQVLRSICVEKNFDHFSSNGWLHPIDTFPLVITRSNSFIQFSTLNNCLNKKKPLCLNDKNIQRTADRAARAAGTIYRVAAGTESFDLDINKQATRSTDDDTDFDHNNDDNDSTSRKLSAGNDNGVMQFPPLYL